MRVRWCSSDPAFDLRNTRLLLFYLSSTVKTEEERRSNANVIGQLARYIDWSWVLIIDTRPSFTITVVENQSITKKYIFTMFVANLYMISNSANKDGRPVEPIVSLLGVKLCVAAECFPLIANCHLFRAVCTDFFNCVRTHRKSGRYCFACGLTLGPSHIHNTIRRLSWIALLGMMHPIDSSLV